MLDFSMWAKLFFIVFALMFLSPMAFVLTIDGPIAWIGEYFDYLIVLTMLPFVAYPFIHALRFYKSGKTPAAALVFIVGLGLPVLSGFFGVFLFEVLIPVGRNISQKKS